MKLIGRILVPSSANQIISLTPTWDAGHLVVVLASTVENSAILVYRIDSSTGLSQDPVYQLTLATADCPHCVVMLPPLEQDDGEESDESEKEQEPIKGPIRMAAVTNSGRLRLLVLDLGMVRWVDLDSMSTRLVRCRRSSRCCRPAL